MTVNEALIRLIIAQIEDTPQHWSQKEYVGHNCNTKFCLAGWALFLTDHLDEYGVPTEKGKKFAEGLEDEFTSATVRLFAVDVNGNEAWIYPYEVAAASVLGLEQQTASDLFSPFSASDFYDLDEAGQYVEDIEILKTKITDRLGIDFNDGKYEFRKVSA